MRLGAAFVGWLAVLTGWVLLAGGVCEVSFVTVLDAPRWLGLEWNRFTVFFAAAAAGFAVTFAVARRLDEPKAGSLETLLREILIQSPQRFWLRLWPRDLAQESLQTGGGENGPSPTAGKIC